MNHLDLYYIHRVDPTIPIEETAGVMKELIESGKDYTLGNFRSYRGNHSKSAQSLPAYSGTESLFYDVQKLRIIVSGTERTTDWFRGFFSIGKWFSDLQI